MKQNKNKIHITKLHDIKWNLLSYIFFYLPNFIL